MIDVCGSLACMSCRGVMRTPQVRRSAQDGWLDNLPQAEHGRASIVALGYIHKPDNGTHTCLE
jgi:hypothetical protein